MFDPEVDPGGVFAGLRRPLVTSEVLAPREASPAGFHERGRLLAEAGVGLVFLPDAPQGIPRAATFPAAAALREHTGLQVVPHLNCRDRNRIALEGMLAAAPLLGIRAVKAVTGDPVAPEAGQGVYELGSSDLVGLVTSWNATARDGRLTPVVGHTLGEAPSGAADERLARKTASGARIVVTTPTLDPGQVEDFLERCVGPGVRVLVGLTLLPGRRVVEHVAQELPAFQVPGPVRERLEAAASPEEEEQVGMEAALEVARRAAPRAAGFNVVPPFGRVEAVLPLVRALLSEPLQGSRVGSPAG